MIEPTEERKDDKRQNRPHNSHPQTPCASDNANRCREPNARSSSYSHNLVLLAHFEDDAATDEANPGKSPLDYSA